MESNMIKYYLDWMNESENPKTNKYCNDMINKLSGAVIHAEKYGKRKKIFVSSLNKVFKSKKEASLALGKSRNYVFDVLKGVHTDVYGIKEIVE
jgi:hypothetical protein